MGRRVSYTRESVERALEMHAVEGRIRSWACFDGRWIILLNTTGTTDESIELRTLWEVRVLVAGLTSAKYTPDPDRPTAIY